MGIIRVCLLAAAAIAVGEPSRATLDPSDDRIDAAVAPPSVSFLTAADGLPSESVEAIVQDRHGYMWIATRGGLVRHEGQRLRVLRHDPEDPTSLPGNNIMSLHAAGDGVIWAGISDQGLVRIEDLAVTGYWPTRAAGGELAGRYIWSIAQACDGAIWVAFARGGVARVDPESGAVVSFGHDQTGVPDDGFNLELRSGPDCGLWLLTLNRLYRSTSIDRPRFEPVVDVEGQPVPPQTALAFDWGHPNRLVTAGMHGVHRFERSPAGWSLDQWARTEASVTGLTVSADGSSWFAEADRILRWADDASEPEVVVRSDTRSTASDAIRGVLVPALHVDNEGGVWIGTSGRGIARLSPAWRGFRSVPIDEGDGPLHHLTAIEADHAGGLWLLDSGRGLRHLSSDGELGPLHAREAISATADLLDLVAGPDGLRLLTDHSLLLFRPERGQVVEQYGIDSHKRPLFRFIEPAETGRYWLATEAELLRIDAAGQVLDRWSIASGQPRPVEGPEDDGSDESGVETQLLDLHRGPEGEWWWLGARTIARLGASGAFEPVHVRDRGSNHAWLFHDDELWLAGDSELRRHSVVDGRLVVQDRFVAGNGLPPGRAQRLLAGDDSIWLLMTTGLARLDPASRRFRVFSEREGLPAMRFASGAAAALPNGRFAAASRDGVLLVDPTRIDRALRPPPVHITSIRAGDRQWQLHPGGADRIDLAWNENSIEFGFATLSFLNPARNRTRLRLDGWDPGWSELEAGDRRYYGNLAPGRYRFEVQAANAAGLWNRDGDAVEVVVAPPPWRSRAAWLAYLTAGLALLAFVLTTGRRRRRRRELRERSRNQRELVDAQRRALGRLTRSLEPTALGRAVVDLVAQLTRASWVRLTFLHPALAATPAIMHGQPMGPADRIRLSGEAGDLAELSVERSGPPLPPEIQGRLALLQATASQMLDHSRLLVQGRQLADKAADASAAKSEFVAAVSHEIRTPLHALGGMLALLRGTELAPEQAEIVRTLSRSTEQLRSMLDASLDLSRIEARALDVDHAPFELVPMLERVVDLHAPNAHSKGLALRFRVHPGLPAAGFGDEDRMAQVLGNLLSNAIKFTESGGIDVEVRPGRPGRLVCSVSDTGPGIPTEARERLFRPFEQLESALTRRSGGAGLGLAICRRLVAATGGTLEVENRRFGGTRFVIDWPVLQVDAAPRSGSVLLRGLRVAADLPAPELRVLCWLGRCWGFRMVDLPAGPAGWRQVDVLIHGPAGVADPAPIEAARSAGCARLCLSAEPEAGETWLRAPLNESRLVGALLSLRFSRSPSGSPAERSRPAPSRGRDRRPA